MKLLEIDYNYYSFPDGIDSLEAFIEYANQHYHSFVKMKIYEENKCVFPHLIEDEYKEVYVNIGQADKISEVEVTLLPRKEYDRRLLEVVKKKCVSCEHFTGIELDDATREKLSLDGECFRYEKKEDL